MFRVYQTKPVTATDEASIINAPLFYFHHGGGHSGLTWALTVKELKQGSLGDKCQTLCFDCRGHGK